MSVGDVRAGVEQAKVNEQGAGFLGVEAILIGCAAGFWASSVLVGVLTGLAVVVGVMVPKARIVVAGVMSVGWAALAGFLGYRWWGTSTAVGLGLLALVLSAGLHGAALEYVRDLSKKS